MDETRISWTLRMGPRASSVALYPIHGALPKVLACAEGQARLKPLAIPSLSEFASEIEDRLLCPARALWHYINELSVLNGRRIDFSL